ncbi:FtsX-like permease family protein, partial [Enterobacter quasiroggenkampii]|nr:FtsX-like permease family protein [Enterobacter quasiroggenkampii]
AYASSGLEANGPAITYSLFKTLNAISDGMMIGVILLVSVLVVAIALMCIRFTLLAKIEDDYREIGVMKAIGLRISDIKGIYLAKYAAIAAAGCVLGYALSFVFKGMLLENIRMYMGESENTSLA